MGITHRLHNPKGIVPDIKCIKLMAKPWYEIAEYIKHFAKEEIVLDPLWQWCSVEEVLNREKPCSMI